MDLGVVLAASVMGAFLAAQALGRSYADLPLLGVSVCLLLRDAFARSGRLRLHRLDLCLLALLAVEAATYAASAYGPNSLLPLYRAGLGTSLYFLTRVASMDERWQGGFFAALSILAALCALRGIASVLLAHTELVSLAGFDDLTQVRHLLRLGAWSDEPGSWIGIHLMLLPFPLILSQRADLGSWRWVAAAIALLVMVAALLTFSRGFYLALAALLAIGLGLQGLYGVRSWRRLAGVALAGAAVLVLVVAWLPCRRAVLVTLRLLENTSQARSVAGRFEVWSAAVDMTEESPVFGVGAGNFALHYGRHRPSERPFVGRALNAPLQLAVEKGWLGLFAGLVSGAVFFMTALGRLRRGPAAEAVVVAWLAAGLGALLVRGLSYSGAQATAAPDAFVYLAVALVAGNWRRDP